jgi:Mrp family chromosome partitioning ATPase
MDGLAGPIAPAPVGEAAWQIVRRALPPPDRLPAELVALHHAVEALRAPGRAVVLQLVSARAGEGTSTIAAGLAELAAGDPARPALLVACAAPSGAGHVALGLAEAQRGGLRLAEAVVADPQLSGLFHAWLSAGPDAARALGPTGLAALLDAARRDYAVTLLDCPSVASSAAALALARHCDGTILVVRAAATPTSVLTQTRTALDRSGARLIGAVLNRQTNSLPPWLEAKL